MKTNTAVAANAAVIDESNKGLVVKAWFHFDYHPQGEVEGGGGLQGGTFEWKMFCHVGGLQARARTHTRTHPCLRAWKQVVCFSGLRCKRGLYESARSSAHLIPALSQPFGLSEGLLEKKKKRGMDG